MNTPISFELAKLLKEKGFNELQAVGNQPVIAEVVIWIYEKHGIWISVDIVSEEHQIGFWYCIRESKNTDNEVMSDEYNSSTEAYEAAILYCLTKLI